MGKDNPEIFRNLLESSIEGSNGIITGKILDEFDQFVHNQKGFSHMYWRAIAFSRWMKIFKVVSA